jgi:hypothetical protein
VLSFVLTFSFISMAQNLSTVPTFDGTNYDYCTARMRLFLKSIDSRNVVETGWTKLANATPELVNEKNA